MPSHLQISAQKGRLRSETLTTQFSPSSAASQPHLTPTPTPLSPNPPTPSINIAEAIERKGKQKISHQDITEQQHQTQTESNEDTETHPLLTRPSSVNRKRLRTNTTESEHEASTARYHIDPTFRKGLKRATKATIGYAIASMFTLIPQLQQIYGETSYLTATGMTWYQPARTIGGMTHAFIMGFLGMSFASILTVITLAAMVHWHDSHYIATVFIALISSFIGAMTFSWLKSKSSHPALINGTTLGFIILFANITKDDPHDVHVFTLHRLLSMLRGLTTGSTISMLTCLLVWPESASTQLRTNISVCLQSLRQMTKLIVKAFLLDDESRIESGDSNHMANRQVLEDAIKEHRNTYTALTASHSEARFEPFSYVFTRMPQYQALILSISRLNQHMSAMSASVFVPVANHQSAESGQAIRRLAIRCKSTLIDLDVMLKTEVYDAAKINQLQTDLRIAIDEFHLETRISAPSPLVHFFAFSLIEYAREIETGLIAGISEITHKKRLTWTDLKTILRSLLVSNKDQYGMDDNKILPATASRPTPMPKPESLFEPNDTSQKFPHVSKGLHEPSPTNFFQRSSGRIWSVLETWRSPHVKFAFKTTMSILIIMLPAFIWPEYRAVYDDFRLDWALVSAYVISSPTVGGTNIAGLYRIFGTVVGCVAAYLSEIAAADLHPLLIIYVPIFIFPAFYLVINTSVPKIGQVSVMAYSVVLLGTYARDETDLDLLPIALKRGAAVTLGCVIGLLTTRYIWPFEARVALRTGLATLLLNMGYLYGLVIEGMETHHNEQTAPNSPRRNSVKSQRWFPWAADRSHGEGPVPFIDIELNLQLSLVSLSSLIPLTKNEPRLKGPFPVDSYQRLVKCCQTILDRFLSMRVASINYRHRHLRRANQDDREQLYGAIMLYFWTLSSALKLKAPLPVYLPPVSQLHNRWSQRIQLAASDQDGDAPVSDMTQVNYSLAYSLAMESVVMELEQVGAILKQLFGEIRYGWDMV